MTTIIGLIGEAGSGKSEIGRMLSTMGCERVSLSDVLREIATKIGLEHSRENLIRLGNTLREQFGDEILARGIEERIGGSSAEYVVVESIRHPEELVYLRSHYESLMIAVVMDEKLKFELLRARGREGDPESWEEYLAFRSRELGEDVGKSDVNVGRCMELCDIKISNDGSLEELREAVNEVYGELYSKSGQRK